MGTNTIIPKHKITSCVLAAVMTASLVISAPLKVEAVSEDIQKQITTLTVSLKHILDNKKDTVLDEIKSEIIKNDWDYTLTMECIDETSIYKDVDYIDMLAAYMTAKEYCKENNIELTYFEDLPLLTYEIEEKTYEEKIPIKVPSYIKNKDGTYSQEGSFYIIEDSTIDTYEKDENGTYKKTGTEDVKLETKEITYADVAFHVITAEQLLSEYDLPEEEFKQYQKRIQALTETTDNSSLYQTMFSRLPQGYTYEGNTELLSESFQRQLIVTTAATLIGMIPYEWGGKPTKPGYDPKWWSFDSNNVQKGLDCSGFVQWVYMTAGYDSSLYSQMTTVANMSQSDVLTEVTKEELRPGDIGAWYGPVTNHVGIYAGNDKWIHCTGGTKRTVVIDDFGFTKFFRAITDDGEIYEDTSPDITSYDLVYGDLSETANYTEDDILLLASLVQHEAGSEGLNGWIGVAEVVKNRLNSELFPNTIPEVIYQPGQFTTASELAGTPPTEEIISTTRMVMEGKLSILNEPTCMYFKNPTITDGLSANDPVDWGKNKYYKPIGHHAFYLQG